MNGCPHCEGSLTVIGSRPRTRRPPDGTRQILIIRRLYCEACERIHHELPDCLVPYKRYDAESLETFATEGRTAAIAADIIGMTGETASTYVAAWNAGGPKAWVPHHSPGQPTKIPPEVAAAEVRSALETPAAVGYGVSANGDSRGLQACLRHRYGIIMSRGGLRKWLHRQGFSWTRPTYVLVKADPARQEALRQALATLKKRHRPPSHRFSG